MSTPLDQLLDQYDKGLLDRRQLLKGLALVTGGALAGGVNTAAEAQSAPMIPAMNINHLNILAKDVKKSAEFYRVLFGAKMHLESPGAALMSFPGATAKSGCWVSINSPSKRPTTDDSTGVPGLSHVGIGINVDPKDFPKLAEDIRKRFPDMKPPNVPKMSDNHPVGPYEVYVFDPDGVAFQLIRPEFDAANMAVLQKK